MSEPYHKITGPDGHLANCRPFRGNTMSAELGTDSVSEHRIYTVYSYRAIIGRYDFESKECLFPEPYRSSKTTTGHINYAKAWLAKKILERSVTVKEVIENWPTKIL